MKKALAVVSSLLIGVAAEAALVRLVPEEGISKAFTLVVDFDKATEKMSVADFRGRRIFAEAEPLKFADGKCVQTLASSQDVRYYGGGQQAGGKTLFEGANMKGSDVPQLIAVDIPSECNWVAFEFKADDESDASLAAKGIWKNVEFSAE